MKLQELKSLVEWDNPIGSNHGKPQISPKEDDSKTLFVTWAGAYLNHTTIRVPCYLDKRKVYLLFVLSKSDNRYIWTMSLATSVFSVTKWENKQQAHDGMNNFVDGIAAGTRALGILLSAKESDIDTVENRYPNVTNIKIYVTNIKMYVKEAVDNLIDF